MTNKKMIGVAAVVLVLSVSITMVLLLHYKPDIELPTLNDLPTLDIFEMPLLLTAEDKERQEYKAELVEILKELKNYNNRCQNIQEPQELIGLVTELKLYMEYEEGLIKGMDIDFDAHRQHDEIKPLHKNIVKTGGQLVGCMQSKAYGTIVHGMADIMSALKEE